MLVHVEIGGFGLYLAIRHYAINQDRIETRLSVFGRGKHWTLGGK